MKEPTFTIKGSMSKGGDTHCVKSGAKAEEVSEILLKQAKFWRYLTVEQESKSIWVCWRCMRRLFDSSQICNCHPSKVQPIEIEED